MRLTALLLAFGFAMLVGNVADAKERWIKPTVIECSMEVGDICGADVSCPEDLPWIVNGGGGMPMASAENHQVGITMNLPISEHGWRVRWRNLGGPAVKVKVAIHALCSDDGSRWGK